MENKKYTICRPSCKPASENVKISALESKLRGEFAPRNLEELEQIEKVPEEGFLYIQVNGVLKKIEIKDGIANIAPDFNLEIGKNGNWFIDGEDTGRPSYGAQGEKGYTKIEISDDGYWIIDGIKQEKSARGPQGEQGATGYSILGVTSGEPVYERDITTTPLHIDIENKDGYYTKTFDVKAHNGHVPNGTLTIEDLKEMLALPFKEVPIESISTNVNYPFSDILSFCQKYIKPGDPYKVLYEINALNPEFDHNYDESENNKKEVLEFGLILEASSDSESIYTISKIDENFLDDPESKMVLWTNYDISQDLEEPFKGLVRHGWSPLANTYFKFSSSAKPAIESMKAKGVSEELIKDLSNIFYTGRGSAPTMHKIIDSEIDKTKDVSAPNSIIEVELYPIDEDGETFAIDSDVYLKIKQNRSATCHFTCSKAEAMGLVIDFYCTTSANHMLPMAPFNNALIYDIPFAFTYYGVMHIIIVSQNIVKFDTSTFWTGLNVDPTQNAIRLDNDYGNGDGGTSSAARLKTLDGETTVVDYTSQNPSQNPTDIKIIKTVMVRENYNSDGKVESYYIDDWDYLTKFKQSGSLSRIRLSTSVSLSDICINRLYTYMGYITENGTDFDIWKTSEVIRDTANNIDVAYLTKTIELDIQNQIIRDDKITETRVPVVSINSDGYSQATPITGLGIDGDWHDFFAESPKESVSKQYLLQCTSSNTNGTYEWVENKFGKQATETEIGGIRARTKTVDDTQEVKIDTVTGKLFTKACVGGLSQEEVQTLIDTSIGNVLKEGF